MIEIVISIVSCALVIYAFVNLIQSYSMRKDVIQKISLQKRVGAAVSSTSRVLNWGVFLHGTWSRERIRIPFILKEFADNLDSEKAFFLIRSRREPRIWKIPEGCVYPQQKFLEGYSIDESCEFIQETLRKKVLVIDPKLGDEIPSELKKVGVNSAIIAEMRFGTKKGVLIVCNSRVAVGKKPYMLSYTRKDCEAAEVFAKVIS